MAETIDNSLRERIDEYVKDEDKIVTCMSLAREFSLSISKAKSVLADYVDQLNESKSNIGVTYLLSGILNETNSFGVCLTNVGDLPKACSTFKHVVAKQAFSVQKNPNISFNAVTLVDKRNGGIDTPLPGSIVSKMCVKTELPAVEELPVTDEKRTVHKGKRGTITTFLHSPLDNTATNLSNGTTKTVEACKNSVGKLESDKNDYQTGSSKANVAHKQSNDASRKIQLKTENSSVSSVSANKKGVKEKTTNGKSSKRKRIEVNSESDSDDIFASDHNDDDKFDASFIDVQDVPPPMVQPNPTTTTKRRKAITKSYLDEEGYVVTKTEYVLEEQSNDEQESNKQPAVLKPQTSNSVKSSVNKSESNSATQVKGKSKKRGSDKQVKGYQSTLTSFFTKK